MFEQHNSALTSRIERLERANRRLTLAVGASLLVPVFALVGWQTPAPSATQIDYLQVHKLEVVDSKGVPMIALNTGRNEEGGSVTLRDKDGERRAWWTCDADGSNLALAKEKAPNSDAMNTAGFSVGAGSSEMNLIGAGNGMFTASIHDDQPKLDLWSAKGASLFSAPWKQK
jgi:hypothetical protein